MKSRTLSYIFVSLLILFTGVIRMPIERNWSQDFLQRKLLKEPLPLDTRQKLGQGFMAITLGGLRSLVAGVLHLRAYGYFENRRWDGVSDTFETIVTLAPNTEFYWDNGFWMMSFNAASHYTNNYDNLPPARAKAEQNRWIRKGINFLEEGLKLNPESSKLWSEYGAFYSNHLKIIDYEKSAEGYKNAAAQPGALPFYKRFEVYAMARSPKLIDQALPLVRKLRVEPGGNVPTLRCLQIALEYRANPKVDLTALVYSIFGNNELEAYRMLSNYLLDFDSDFPSDGVETALIPLRDSLRAKAFELLKDPSMKEQALILFRELSQGYGGGDAPIRTIRLALEIEADPTLPNPGQLFASWYPTAREAYNALQKYEKDDTHNYPKNGIKEALSFLKETLDKHPQALDEAVPPPTSE